VPRTILNSISFGIGLRVTLVFSFPAAFQRLKPTAAAASPSFAKRAWNWRQPNNDLMGCKLHG
jgi:hypothetical protein